MTQPPAPAAFRERLIPGPGLYLVLLLIVPAVMLTVTPIQQSLALPVAIAVYLIVAGALTAMSPVVAVSGGELEAGRARIPVSALGEAELLDGDALRAAIGPGTDARSYLLVRGYIHSGVRIEVIDPEDPTPCWVVTSRRPAALAAAIDAARPEAPGQPDETAS